MEVKLCKHNEYCNVRKAQGRGNCFAMQEPVTCQTYKFYEKYGMDWNNLGIGATVVPPKGLSVKALEELDNGGLQL